MSLLLVGLTYRTAPIDLLERVAIPHSDIASVLRGALTAHGVTEAVILSTCGRTEIYAATNSIHEGTAELQRLLIERSGLPADRLGPHLVIAHDAAVAQHLFTVATGLDSAILGETQIVNQIRTAFTTAQQEHSAGPRLSDLFRHALSTGKRARAETSISRRTTSVSHAAVELAIAHLGTLDALSVLVLGTGEVGASIAKTVRSTTSANISLTNRTPGKAISLAARLQATAVPMHDLPQALLGVDVLFTATSSASAVVERRDIATTMASRGKHQLLIIDTAMPRDVDPSTATIPGVTLLDLDAIHRLGELSLDSRRREIGAVKAIVAEECSHFAVDATARLATPFIVSLRVRADNIRISQLARFDSRLADLTPRQHEIVETLTKQLVSQLLHEPTMHLKKYAGKSHRTETATNS